MNLLLKWPWVPHPLRGGLPLQRRHPPHFAVLSCAFPARRENDNNLLVLDGFGVHPQTNLYGCGSSTPSLKNAAGMDKNWNVHNLPAGSQKSQQHTEATQPTESTKLLVLFSLVKKGRSGTLTNVLSSLHLNA